MESRGNRTFFCGVGSVSGARIPAAWCSNVMHAVRVKDVFHTYIGRYAIIWAASGQQALGNMGSMGQRRRDKGRVGNEFPCLNQSTVAGPVRYQKLVILHAWRAGAAGPASQPERLPTCRFERARRCSEQRAGQRAGHETGACLGGGLGVVGVGRGRGRGLLKAAPGRSGRRRMRRWSKARLDSRECEARRKRGEARGERREARGERGGFGRGKADRRTATAVCHTGGDACAHVSREGLGNCKSSSWRGGWRLPG